LKILDDASLQHDEMGFVRGKGKFTDMKPLLAGKKAYPSFIV
jgi:hypothetical protein